MKESTGSSFCRWGPIAWLGLLVWAPLSWAQGPCRECHESVYELLAATPHARVAQEERFCQSCHGETDAHLATGTLEGLVTGEQLGSWSGEQKAAACLGCHQSTFPLFKASVHGSQGICWECHESEALHFGNKAALRPQGFGVAPRCISCHQEVLSQFRQPYRHPLSTGNMDCVSCHEVHQPAGQEGERRGCVDCHREQAGPFLFPHPPAEEGCVTCHAPHGSAHRGLLVSTGNGLCLSCHTQSNFPAVGKVPHNYWLGGGGRCWDCHSQVHGSNVTPDLNPRGRR